MKNCFVLLAALALPMSLRAQTVSMGEEKISLPTYQLGPAEKDPIFFTGRVYQGAEGYIYPYPLYDVLTDKKAPKDYNILRLKNEYVNIGVLPEIGGRILQATDETNGYHFFYTQTGIKPALIGMLGAWLSGGVEWNIPDHHRASSYMPVDWKMEENADGSKTIWVGETELRHRLRWSVGVTVYPGRSWVEARVRVINPTPMIQSMLYWANVSVHCNNDYQVIFPPDVQFGVDHHKVYFTRWPIGPRGHNTGGDTDLSWWKNFTQDSRSIFAWGSKMDFLAGYDYGKNAGTVHVANRFQVPGKKFFLWGNNPNGRLWNKILSDNDGDYLELMVGAYSDNQPDYSWIGPGEIRVFSQIWFPIKGIQGCKNANTEGAVNFRPVGNGQYLVGYNVTKKQPGARVLVKYKDEVLMDKKVDLSPENFFLENVKVPQDCDSTALTTALYDASGKKLVAYTPVKITPEPLPKVIDGTKPVKEYKTNEELYLAGLRVDQFNNARLKYMDFYEEALSRDSLDARVNIEVGKHYIRQGEWAKAEHHLLRAQKRLAHDYTRVKNAEAQYYLGYLYRLLDRPEESEENLWACTYTPDFKHAAFYQLALNAAACGNFGEALQRVDNSLLVGAHDTQALVLKAYLLRQLQRKDEAAQVLQLIKTIDPLDYMSEAEESFLKHGDARFVGTTRKYRSDGIIAVQELLEMADNYITFGNKADALRLIDAAVAVGQPFADYPLVHLYRAYCLLPADGAGAAAEIEKAGKLNPDNNFPLRIEELALFERLLEVKPQDAGLHYYYGNLLWYLGQKQKGLREWHAAADAAPKFALACRNVGFGEGQMGNLQTALTYYDKAIASNPNDPLLLTESDKICEKAALPAATRLKRLEKHYATVLRHDDAVMRLLSLYNETGRYDKASALMDSRHFHLWEGGGEIHNIYVDAHMLNGLKMLDNRKYDAAIKEFDLAMLYPANLEVAPSVHGGFEAKACYLQGLAYEGLGRTAEAKEAFQKASVANEGGTSDLMYFKVKALRKLGATDEARKLTDKMVAARTNLEKNLVDNYAKFGAADKNVQQSKLKYFSGLIDDLQGDRQKANAAFEEALKLNPDNIWAAYMLRSKTR